MPLRLGLAIKVNLGFSCFEFVHKTGDNILAQVALLLLSIALAITLQRGIVHCCSVLVQLAIVHLRSRARAIIQASCVVHAVDDV